MKYFLSATYILCALVLFGPVAIPIAITTAGTLLRAKESTKLKLSGVALKTIGFVFYFLALYPSLLCLKTIYGLLLFDFGLISEWIVYFHTIITCSFPLFSLVIGIILSKKPKYRTAGIILRTFGIYLIILIPVILYLSHDTINAIETYIWSCTG